MRLDRTSMFLFALLCTMPIALLGCEEPPTQGSSGAVPVSFSVSDAAVGELEAVVVTIDRVTINRPGDDIVIETFPTDDPDAPESDTITVDLLDYRGLDSKLIIEDLMLDPGRYQNVRISIVDTDIDLTHVDERDGDRRPLKVPSGELKLGGFEVDGGGPQIFVIEFPLKQVMVYNPGPRRYILKPRGIRIVGVEEASMITGTVAPELFSTGDCSSKPDELAGNVVYLYQGHDLDVGRLGDLFDPEIDEDAAADLIEPYTSETVAADGSYLIAYLPAGMYTIAFACNAADDDPEYDDGIEIPDPKSEWAEIDLAPGDERECDFPVASGGCT